jgi:regulator of sigma E protease
MAMDEDGNVDLELRRNGEKLLLENYHLVPLPYDDGNGGTVMKYGIYFDVEPGGFVNTVKYSWYNCLDFVRMVRMGLSQLLHGQAAVSDMTGVVGIVDIINETGQSAPTTAQGLENVLYLVAFIAVNLSVMNMLPIPALDGGHIVTLLLAGAYKKLAGKKPDPRIEGYIHFVGLILLLGLMALVFFNDIVRILQR